VWITKEEKGRRELDCRTLLELRSEHRGKHPPSSAKDSVDFILWSSIPRAGCGQ
jgi:hypothetical protein